MMLGGFMKIALPAAFVSAIAAMISGAVMAYDIDFGPLGHACDTCGGGVIGGLPVIGHALTEAQAQAAGNALEQWIVASRNSAIGGAMPIPSYIRQQLTGYASEDSMNRVLYKIGDNGVANLANVIEKGGPTSAVTLIDIIIFRGPSEANDPSLWAHELTHVDQYREWGVHSFAIQYARDFNSVENPAYAKGNGYWAWAQGGRPVPMQPTGMGHLCVVQPPNGPYGVRDMGQLYPLGSLCSNYPYWGAVQ